MYVAIVSGCITSSLSRLDERSGGGSPSGIWAHQASAGQGVDTLGDEVVVQGFTPASPSRFEQQNVIGVPERP